MGACCSTQRDELNLKELRSILSEPSKKKKKRRHSKCGEKNPSENSQESGGSSPTSSASNDDCDKSKKLVSKKKKKSQQETDDKSIPGGKTKKSTSDGTENNSVRENNTTHTSDTISNSSSSNSISTTRSKKTSVSGLSGHSKGSSSGRTTILDHSDEPSSSSSSSSSTSSSCSTSSSSPSQPDDDRLEDALDGWSLDPDSFNLEDCAYTNPFVIPQGFGAPLSDDPDYMPDSAEQELINTVRLNTIENTKLLHEGEKCLRDVTSNPAVLDTLKNHDGNASNLEVNLTRRLSSSNLLRSRLESPANRRNSILKHRDVPALKGCNGGYQREEAAVSGCLANGAPLLAETEGARIPGDSSRLQDPTKADPEVSVPDETDNDSHQRGAEPESLVFNLPGSIYSVTDYGSLLRDD